MSTINSTFVSFADHGRADLRDMSGTYDADAEDPKADARTVFAATLAIIVVTVVAVWFGA